MDSHLEEYVDLMSKLPKITHEHALSIARHTLFPEPELPSFESGDLSLSELSDYDEYMSSPMNDSTGYGNLTVEHVVERIEELASNGVSAAFLVSSLLRTTEESFRLHADPAHAKQRLEAATVDIARIEHMKKLDSPENAASWDAMLAFTRRNVEHAAEHFAAAQTEYVIWCDVTGARLDQPCEFGTWPDLVEREMQKHPEQGG
jgi:hypothetical protein